MRLLCPDRCGGRSSPLERRRASHAPGARALFTRPPGASFVVAASHLNAPGNGVTATPWPALLAGFADDVALPAVAPVEQVDARAAAACAHVCIRQGVAATDAAGSTIRVVVLERIRVPAVFAANLAFFARSAAAATVVRIRDDVDAPPAAATSPSAARGVARTAVAVAGGKNDATAIAAREPIRAGQATARAAAYTQTAAIAASASGAAAAAMVVIGLGIDAPIPAQGSIRAPAHPAAAGQLIGAGDVAASAVVVVVGGIDAERTAQDLIGQTAASLALTLNAGVALPAALAAATAVQGVVPLVDADTAAPDHAVRAFPGLLLAPALPGLRAGSHPATNQGQHASRQRQGRSTARAGSLRQPAGEIVEPLPVHGRFLACS